MFFRIEKEIGVTTMLRVATHNVCHMGYDPVARTQAFPDGKYRFGYTEDFLERMKENWKNVYASFRADLIGIQEYYYWMDFQHEIESARDLYSSFGYRVTDGDHGLAIATDLPLEPVYEAAFEPVSNRRRQKFYLDLNGQKVAVFNSHPTPRDNADIRRQEYGILLEEFAKEPCFIAFGDYNARTGEEYRVFEEAGYPMVNTGFMTAWSMRTDAYLACDNIIVSPNIRILKTALFDPGYTVSDHQVLYAEIELP